MATTLGVDKKQLTGVNPNLPMNPHREESSQLTRCVLQAASYNSGIWNWQVVRCMRTAGDWRSMFAVHAWRLSQDPEGTTIQNRADLSFCVGLICTSAIRRNLLQVRERPCHATDLPMLRLHISCFVRAILACFVLNVQSAHTAHTYIQWVLAHRRTRFLTYPKATFRPT